MKHSRRPICVHRSAARRARQGALHNRRGAGLQECVRAAAYAVCRRRFAARRRGFAERKDVFAVCRDFRGFRKVVLRALAPARPVRRAPFPIRSATDTGFRRPGGERTAVRTGRSASVLACAGGACGYAVIGCATPTAGAAYAGCCFGAQARERCVRRASRCGKIAKKDSLLVPGGGFCRRPQRRFCARFGRLRLLAGKHVCVPKALSAADAESRQKEIFRPCGGRCGTAAGG